MQGSLKGWWRAIAIWTAVGFLLSFGAAWLFEWLFVFAVFVYGAFALAGIVAFAALVWMSFGAIRQRWLLIAAMPASATVLVISFPWLAALGGDALLKHQFEQNATCYEAIVAAAESANRPAPPSCGGIAHQIDRGPPLPVAFAIGGFLDNWHAFVYDPSGRIDDLDWNDPSQASLRKLFGGDLVACRRLRDRFYHCGFT